MTGTAAAGDAGRIIEQSIVSDRREAGRGTRRGRSGVQLEHGRAVKRAERTRLRRPVEVPERLGEAVEMVFGSVVIAIDALEVGRFFQADPY